MGHELERKEICKVIQQQMAQHGTQKKSRIILPLKELRRFHVYVVWYDICMVRCIAWHRFALRIPVLCFARSALCYRVVTSLYKKI